MNPADLYEKLLNASFRFISYRPRSKKEIRDFLQNKLKKWKVAGQATVEKVMTRLSELGYLDDFAFTRWWLEQRQQHRPKGRRVLVRELKTKGVKKDIIDDALDCLGKESQEKETIKKLAQKKLIALGKLPILEQKAKLVAFLLRRGFETEDVYNVIDELLGNE